MKESTAMQNLPPYLFARIEKRKSKLPSAGLGCNKLGDRRPWISPLPSILLPPLTRAVHDPANHQYPSSVGLLRYRETWPAGIKAVLEWSWIPVPR